MEGKTEANRKVDGALLVRIVGEQNAAPLIRVSDIAAEQRRQAFFKGVKEMSGIKNQVAKYLETEQSFLEACGLGDKNTSLVDKVKAIVLRRDPKTYPLERHLSSLLGLFGKYRNRLEEITGPAEQTYQEVEQQLDDTLNSQKNIDELVQSATIELETAQTEYEAADNAYTEATAKNKNGVTDRSEELALREDRLNKQRVLDKAGQRLAELIIGYNFAENSFQAIEAFRNSAQTALREAKQTAVIIGLVEENLGPFFRYMSHAAKVAEVGARSVQNYEVVRNAVNAIMLGVARVSRASANMLEGIVDKPFILPGVMDAVRTEGQLASQESAYRGQIMLAAYNERRDAETGKAEVVEGEYTKE
ncbi:hypothetical protein HZA33_02625 [Candidatus Pacearchaeota archaeon]|nr:hypothetical protein [Candidatus Pacearchaeota archaeon]